MTSLDLIHNTGDIQNLSDVILILEKSGRLIEVPPEDYQNAGSIDTRVHLIYAKVMRENYTIDSFRMKIANGPEILKFSVAASHLRRSMVSNLFTTKINEALKAKGLPEIEEPFVKDDKNKPTVSKIAEQILQEWEGQFKTFQENILKRSIKVFYNPRQNVLNDQAEFERNFVYVSLNRTRSPMKFLIIIHKEKFLSKVVYKLHGIEEEIIEMAEKEKKIRGLKDIPEAPPAPFPKLP